MQKKHSDIVISTHVFKQSLLLNLLSDFFRHVHNLKFLKYSYFVFSVV